MTPEHFSPCPSIYLYSSWGRRWPWGCSHRPAAPAAWPSGLFRPEVIVPAGKGQVQGIQCQSRQQATGGIGDGHLLFCLRMVWSSVPNAWALSVTSTVSQVSAAAGAPNRDMGCQIPFRSSVPAARPSTGKPQTGPTDFELEFQHQMVALGSQPSGDRPGVFVDGCVRQMVASLGQQGRSR